MWDTLEDSNNAHNIPQLPVNHLSCYQAVDSRASDEAEHNVPARRYCSHVNNCITPNDHLPG